MPKIREEPTQRGGVVKVLVDRVGDDAQPRVNEGLLAQQELQLHRAAAFEKALPGQAEPEQLMIGNQAGQSY